ncbi:hypothetical protein B9Z19DRAFT_1120241 [Tuber borchii]|uniref:Uncharacterized protein n=1 Tax=Tuber borchii TaxID=42251 RepID=A0A2T7A4N4_TUBBO|nr:hypothetical protein B9Z19DRAFT_1120241 [Tuber borchii]
MSSDTEADAHNLNRAQRIEMIFSPISSTLETQHIVRTILRGEHESIVKEAEEGDDDTLMPIYAIDQDTVEDGGKIVLDDKIAGELTETPSPVSKIGDISERSMERTETGRERCVAAEAIAWLVGKLLGEVASRGAIDFMDPTLVVLGSHDISALEGVLLGSGH